MAYQFQVIPRTTNPHHHGEACTRRDSGITGRLSHRQECHERQAILEAYYTLNGDPEAEAEAEAYAEAYPEAEAYPLRLRPQA